MGWYNNVQAQRANASLAGEDEVERRRGIQSSRRRNVGVGGKEEGGEGEGEVEV